MCERVEVARSVVIQRLTRVLNGKDAEDFERIATKILAAFGSSGTDGSSASSGGS